MTKLEYKKYLKTEHWQVTRKHKLEQSKYTCAICGSHSRLQVHHLTYENIGKEAESDLVVLCSSCHKLVHNIK